MEHGIFDAAATDLLFRHAAVPMTLLARHPDGRVVVLAVNPAGAEAAGWDPATIAGTAITDLYPADHAARTEAFVGELSGPGATVDYRVEAEVASGRRAFEVRMIGLGDRDGVFLVFSMSTDVTRREAAESALEETQRMARIGHFSWNLETDELTWTDQMYDLFGVPVGTVVTIDHAFGLVDDETAVRAAVADAIERRGEYEVEFAFTRPDGELRAGITRGRSVVGRDGTVVRVAGTTQDVTEQRAAETDARSLERARARQAQALELNDDVMQGLATVRVALMEDERETAMEVLDRTLEAARAIISDLLRDHLGTGPVPGDLVRRSSSSAFRGRRPGGGTADPPTGQEVAP